AVDLGDWLWADHSGLADTWDPPTNPNEAPIQPEWPCGALILAYRPETATSGWESRPLAHFMCRQDVRTSRDVRHDPEVHGEKEGEIQERKEHECDGDYYTVPRCPHHLLKCRGQLYGLVPAEHRILPSPHPLGPLDRPYMLLIRDYDHLSQGSGP